ncbi:uncharacterized protein L969DRAFT_104897 [Mixia osmundae IAM 14324]|uniref:Rad51-like C-terminal domain-containing protein n=1 Tax=Mixia osmundae (strain CBS 9802 / IAM 14324 / JCM 22182 / KY 12970) TaxID=764103 RepID=G7EA76_MIXOS|nr:uncharacterized protein L969DRAFT_104897 [Mixia osmundae IAM 14324]KEI37634.1 hypothetical protein L969DRAFT_104897 [Mixia osmundae IAM 14324]GAA99736.1 hypothetical protein E5Q_06439 [Mixia osmundae IAM 14324]
MRLDECLPLQQPELDWTAYLDYLSRQQIISNVDLLFNSSVNVPPQHREQHQIAQQIAIRTLAPVPVLGTHAAEREERVRTHAPPLLTGVKTLDETLQGGLYPGELIELAGQPSLSRTTLALHIVVRELLHAPTSAGLWIDARGSFDIKRALAVFEALQRQDHRFAALEPDAIFDKWEINTAFDPAACLLAIDSSLKSLVDQSTRLRIVVLDGIDVLFNGLGNSGSTEQHAAMVTFMRDLQAIASSAESPLTVLVVNKAVNAGTEAPFSAFSTTKHKPALGPTFAQLARRTIWIAERASADPLARPDRVREAYIEVVRDRTGLAGTWAPFLTDGAKLLSMPTE